MQITETRIKLMNRPGGRDVLRAFATILLDRCFVIRDLRLIEEGGGFFVAMPSRRITDRCKFCNNRNHLAARFCSECGWRLPDGRGVPDEAGRVKFYADICHPTGWECRREIVDAVLGAYRAELVLAEQPDYVSRYHDASAEVSA